MLRNWFKKRIEKKQSKNRCGVYPFQTGKWDIFQQCCSHHDVQWVAAYIAEVKFRLSICKTCDSFSEAISYIGGMNVRTEEGVTPVMVHVPYTVSSYSVIRHSTFLQLLKFNEEFCECLRFEARRYPWVVRWVTIPWGEAYAEIVEEFSLDIWAENFEELWNTIESGEKSGQEVIRELESKLEQGCS